MIGFTNDRIGYTHDRTAYTNDRIGLAHDRIAHDNVAGTVPTYFNIITDFTSVICLYTNYLLQ